MNIAFFLTPKSELVFIEKHITIRQALETMEYHRYTQVCVIDKHGRYVDALSEGDLLWHLKHKEGLMFKDTEKESIDKVKRYRETKPVLISSDIESLIELSVSQSFVPVVDDQGIFIGIIKRSDIINYCMKKMGYKGNDERIA